MAQAAEAASAKRRGRAAKDPSMSRDQLLQAYRDMLLIRRFEEKAGQLYGMGLIGGATGELVGKVTAGGAGEILDSGVPMDAAAEALDAANESSAFESGTD